jgi:hypothetical protein
LHIVEEENVETAILEPKKAVGAIADGVDEFGDELVDAHIADLEEWIVFDEMPTQGLKEVSLSRPGIAIEIEWADNPEMLGNFAGALVGQTIVGVGHITLKGILGVENGRKGRGRGRNFEGPRMKRFGVRRKRGRRGAHDEFDLKRPASTLAEYLAKQGEVLPGNTFSFEMAPGGKTRPIAHVINEPEVVEPYRRFFPGELALERLEGGLKKYGLVSRGHTPSQAGKRHYSPRLRRASTFL